MTAAVVRPLPPDPAACVQAARLAPGLRRGPRQPDIRFCSEGGAVRGVPAGRRQKNGTAQTAQFQILFDKLDFNAYFINCLMEDKNNDRSTA